MNETSKEPNLSGKQPEHRLVDAAATYDMVYAAKEVCDSRTEAWSEVQKMLDRLPPDDPQKLKQAGMGQLCNVDWGFMRDGIEAAVEQKYHIATKPDPFLRIRCRKNGVPNKQEIIKVLEEEDSIMMRDWGEFGPVIESMLVHQKTTGMGLTVFEQHVGWTFRDVHPINLIFPVSASINPDTWPWCAIKTTFDLTEILKIISNEDVAEKSGYDKEVAKEYVKHAAKDGSNAINFAETKDEAFIRGDYSRFDSYSWDDKKLEGSAFIVFVKEYDGSISEQALVRVETSQGNNGWKFLYRKSNRYKKLSHCLCLFPDALGQTIMRKIRGYGIEMLPTFDVQNRTRNQLVDYTLLSSSMLFKGKQDDVDKFNEILFGGPFTFIPDALDYQQKAFGDPSSKLLGLASVFDDSAVSQNLANGGASDGRETPLSATGERIRFHQNRQRPAFEIDKFIDQLSNLHRQRWDRMVNHTKEKSSPGFDLLKDMKDRCKERNVDFNKNEVVKYAHRQDIKANRTVGNGNTNETLFKLNDSMNLYGGQMSPEGRRNWAEDAHEALYGDKSSAERYLGPSQMEGDRESADRWDAQQENAQFMTKVKIQPKTLHNHLIHLQIHSQFDQGIEQQYEQKQISLQEIVEYKSNMYEHASVHIQLLGQQSTDPEVIAEVNRYWSEGVVNRIKQLAAQLKKQQEAEAQAQAEAQQIPQHSPKEMAEAQAVQQESMLKQSIMKSESDAKVATIIAQAEASTAIKLAERNVDDYVKLSRNKNEQNAITEKS